MDWEKEDNLKKGLVRTLNTIIGELEEINDRFSLDLCSAKAETDSIPFFLSFLREEKEELEHSIESKQMDVDEILYSLGEVQERLSEDIINIIDDYEPSYKYDLIDEFELSESLQKLSKKTYAIAKALRQLDGYEMEANDVYDCAISIAMLAEHP